MTQCFRVKGAMGEYGYQMEADADEAEFAGVQCRPGDPDPVTFLLEANNRYLFFVLVGVEEAGPIAMATEGASNVTWAQHSGVDRVATVGIVNGGQDVWTLYGAATGQLDELDLQTGGTVRGAFTVTAAYKVDVNSEIEDASVPEQADLLEGRVVIDFQGTCP